MTDSESIAPMVKEWVMNHDDFDRFLVWLHPDRDEAAKKYEEIRRRLIKMFESRGCTEAEDLADETFDRVVRKVPEIAETYVGDPALYCYGVGRKVRLERCHRPRPPVPPPVPPSDDPHKKELRDACLEECMKELPPDDRRLALLYYTGDGRAKIERRQKLAEELGGSNALRIRMYRIRTMLHVCISRCLKKTAE
jgi:DNA-directed RNA polymerase specialized sigma24 family protein